MNRFNTGNNLNSLDERDFYDNSMALDQAMNSTEPTWRDRFNVEKPTIDAALKSAGFMPAGFDFVTGGTLQPGDRNKAVYNPAPNGDNNWYRWNGAFPKVIAANSQPNPKNENNWVLAHFRIGIVEKEALRRTYLEAGYNLVNGSFEQGGTLVNSNDVLLQERTGKAFSGPVGVVAAGTDPTLPGSGYVSRTDVLLRNELAGAGGAGLVGFRQGSAGSAAITVEGKLRERISVKDFGGKSGFTYDSSDALVAFINAINSGAHEGSEFLIDGLYRTTKPLPTITRPISLSGVIPANSAILFDNVTDGLSIDLSAMTSNTVHSVVSHFAILTNKNIAGTGFRYLGNKGASQSVKLEFDSMRVDSLNRFMGKSSSEEWLIGIHIGDQAFAAKPSEIRINNAIVYGSDLNSSYSTLTAAGSSGIVVEKSTNCIITESKIALLSDCGIMFRGQSEGNGVYDSQVIAVKHGIVYAELVNPSNNHFIDNVHINPYITGIAFQTPAGNPSTSTPIQCYINNVFILERHENVAKSSTFIGVDAAVRFSKFVNVTVWANAKSPDLHTKIGFRIGCGGNILTNCHSHRMSYGIELFEMIPGFDYDVALDEFFEEDSILGFASPASFKLPTGNSRALSLPGRTYRRPTMWANQFSIVHENGTTIFDMNAGTISNKSATGPTTVYRHLINTSNVEMASLIGVGGDGVTTHSGNWILRSALTQFRGSLTPETANTNTIGTPGLPWSGGFTQTAFTVTSDERYKTAPLDITDVMLDAAAEVDWCMFQYLDRVEEKGADGARWHFGAIAQRFVEAFRKHGLDPFRFAFICHDEWAESPELIGEDGEVISHAVDAGSRYGIRYEQAIILKQKQIERDHKRQIDDLVARIEALEGN